VLWDLKFPHSLPNWLGATILVVGFFLGGMSQFLKPDNSFYPLVFGSSADFLRANILAVWTVAATLIVFVTIRLRAFQSLLMLHTCQFLGRISFSLYLVHFPILGSLTSTLFLNFGRNSAAGIFTVLMI
jgi:peptidoglycan/LPS O-acetylase OafA/YrhL